MSTLMDENIRAEDHHDIEVFIGDLLQVSWFSHKEKGEKQEIELLMNVLLRELNVEQFHMEWVGAAELKKVISNMSFSKSVIWSKVKDLPQQLLSEINRLNHEERLEKVIDRVPELIFHEAFNRAYEVTNDYEVVKYLTVLAMYCSIILVLAQLSKGEQIVRPLYLIISKGYVPLGIKGNTLFLF